MTLRIPLAKPEITETDREAVLAVLRTSHLSTGPKVHEFEERIAAFAGNHYAVAVNSGTSALHLALRVLDIPAGSEVILPSFAFGAVLNVVLQEHLVPVFVDIDEQTYNTTPQLIEQAITTRTRAIIAVHTFGTPVDMPGIRILADARRVPVIEDACEALGAGIGARKAGSFGQVGLFAFYPNKQITTGEGGILLTEDSGLAAHAARLRNQGRDTTQDWYQHSEVGYSYRISDMNCALGLSQVARIEETLCRRQWLAELYDRKLSAIDGVIRPSIGISLGRISWFCYVIRLANEFGEEDRNAVCESLTRCGIGNARYFAPLHRQPVLSGYASSRSVLPITESVAARVIALPFFNQLTEAEIDDVCSTLEDSLSRIAGRKT